MAFDKSHETVFHGCCFGQFYLFTLFIHNQRFIYISVFDSIIIGKNECDNSLSHACIVSLGKATKIGMNIFVVASPKETMQV
jgi:hypothetical protein